MSTTAWTARVAQRGVSKVGMGVSRVGQVLERLRLRLRAVEVSRDPEVKRWVAEQRAKVQSGEIWVEFERQPDDPREIVDRYRPRPA